MIWGLNRNGLGNLDGAVVRRSRGRLIHLGLLNARNETREEGVELVPHVAQDIFGRSGIC